MDYFIKGTITSSPYCGIPFEIRDGRIFIYALTASGIKDGMSHFVLLGRTTEGKAVQFLVDYLYYCDLEFSPYLGGSEMWSPHVEGFVEACAVMEDDSSIDSIESIGFYSRHIPNITGDELHGYLNDLNFPEAKRKLATYQQKGHIYELSIGFLESEPCYRGQLLELKAEKPFDLDMLSDSYWVIRKLLIFLYQKWMFPLEPVVLRNGGRKIGSLYVEKTESSEAFGPSAKCMCICGWNNKLNALLQHIVDGKLYLRHLPSSVGDERTISSGRFLMALIGLENALGVLDVHADFSEKHKKAIQSAKQTLLGLAEEKTGSEKGIYRELAKVVEGEAFHLRIKKAIQDNNAQIANFFNLRSLGDDVETIAQDLAKARNKLAHGDLGFGLTNKCILQMQFLSLFVLYLQLLSVGFEKEEAKMVAARFLFPAY